MRIGSVFISEEEVRISFEKNNIITYVNIGTYLKTNYLQKGEEIKVENNKIKNIKVFRIVYF